MNIIITESQYNLIKESKIFTKASTWLLRKILNENYNFKPSYYFDKMTGTNVSKKYDKYPMDLNENQIWRLFHLCYAKNKKCDDFNRVCESMSSEHIDIPGIDSMDIDKKTAVILGMASRFNEDDIEFFVSFPKGTPIFLNNPNNKDIEKINEVTGVEMEWVPSKPTIEKIKKQLNIKDIY
jgi:hypothetical protein